ncbi:MAG TPA: 8-oxoguanine DNA glycosylase [Clostridiales bacterium]|nr:MAG: hypothetical protein A2Y18_08060 [Clostridiales bacterium GWD2_32_19]HCC08330.1 8-oxoguanine DNA glycosylase [Clostridiales bacterium]
MTYKQENNNIIITNLTHFDIDETLDSGQCFRYEQIGESEYIVVAYRRILRIKQENETLTLYNTTLEEYEKIWHKYFSFDEDYENIKNILSGKDEIIREAINYAPGVRILKQDLWEMIITFILSANNNIKRIKQGVLQISEKYGEFIAEVNGVKYYSFPTSELLSKATVLELHELKIGFRDKYIVDACSKVASSEVDFENLANMSTDEAKKELLKIKGIGNKVADCILLFGLHRYEVFPTDTWIKKVMISLYIKKDVKIEEITKYALEHFGENSSYAQQYLFHYARKNKIS